MTHQQQRAAVLKAWAQECGLTERQAALAMLRFGIEEFNRGIAGLKAASLKLAASVRALGAVLTAEPDTQVLRKLGIAPVPNWPKLARVVPAPALPARRGGPAGARRRRVA